MISASIPNPTRKAVYRRDGYRCALCDSTKGLQVHHAIPRSQGGNNTEHNLITLCATCHATAHGTRLPEVPDYMDAAELEQACVEYLADLYGPEWWPWRRGQP